MPRKPRVLVDGGIYHVFSRVTRREQVFKDQKTADVFVDQLARIKSRDGFVLFAWVLMANHYHLLLRTTTVPLPRTMASLQVGFAKRFNRFHGFVGPFWQGRYQAILVEDQRYFDQLLAYVHLNPVTAGLVPDPAMYEYSGHREILGRSNLGLVDVAETLLVFDSSLARARRQYVRAVRGARDTDWIGESPGHLPWWRGIRPGSGELTDRIKNPSVPIVDELGRSAAMERPTADVSELVLHVCELMQLDLDDLTGPSRERVVVRAREAIALVGFECYSIRLKEIAAVLRKGQDTASRWLSRAAKRRREDEEFKRLVDRLDCRVAAGKGDELVGEAEGEDLFVK